VLCFSPLWLWGITAQLAAVERSNHDRQNLTVPWTVVEDAATARRFTDRRGPRPIPGFTSIGGAIAFSTRLLSAAPFEAARRVIDVPGNGPNNDGSPVDRARDVAVAAGASINGLPILDAVGGIPLVTFSVVEIAATPAGAA